MKIIEKINCIQTRRNIKKYFADNLPYIYRIKYFSHIKKCPKCLLEFEKYNKVSEYLKNLHFPIEKEISYLLDLKILIEKEKLRKMK